MADDLIVNGCGIEEHDQNMHVVLTRFREKGLTLNGDKCQFHLAKLTFFCRDRRSQGRRHPECQFTPRYFPGQVFSPTRIVLG